MKASRLLDSAMIYAIESRAVRARCPRKTIISSAGAAMLNPMQAAALGWFASVRPTGEKGHCIYCDVNLEGDGKRTKIHAEECEWATLLRELGIEAT